MCRGCRRHGAGLAQERSCRPATRTQRSAAQESVDYEDKRASFVTTASLRHISTTEEQANLALFLASDECRAIIGQSIVCDGGVCMLG